MTASWQDFNDAPANPGILPKNELAKVRSTIRPGGHDDPSRGWTGGYATQNQTTGSVYLNCEFVVLDGPYARRKMWSLIGLHSNKGPEWANMGRAYIKGILNSARGLHPQDNSPQAQQARRISGFVDLDGIEFVGKVEMEKDQYGEDKNVIKLAITPDRKDYAAVMGTAAPQPAQQTPAPQQQPAAAPTGRPSWAQ